MALAMTSQPCEPSVTVSRPTITCEPWVDQVLDAVGWPVRSAYCELCVVCVLGPTATLLLRTLNAEMQARGGLATLDLTDLALSLGVGPGVANTSTIRRTLRRLEAFDMVRPSASHYLVRTSVAPLTERQLERHGSRVQALHRSLMARRQR
jgi:hypothetical protein